MSDEIVKVENGTEEEKKASPTHAEIFFRNIAALAQVAGVQAFAISVAVPKEDGTSAVMAMAAGIQNTTREWQLEMARLLGEQAVVACKNIIQPEKADEITKPAEVV